MTHVHPVPGGAPDASLVVVAIGPDRVVARAVQTAVSQAVDSALGQAEIVVVHDRPDDTAARRRVGAYLGGHNAVFVGADTALPGAVRNAGVARSTGRYFQIVDGSEALAPGHVSTALQALDAAPDAPFAAPPGASLFGAVTLDVVTGNRIDAAALVAGPWSTGPATVRRSAFDGAGGYDASLPALADWDLLLTLTGAGATGVALRHVGSRYVDDDVRLREDLGVGRHLPAMRRIVARHQGTFERCMKAALVGRERLAQALWRREHALLRHREQVHAELASSLEALSNLRPALARHGRRALDFGDLRRTSPVSRNWGSERGLPVDRHYIHAFLAAHAGDVRGCVLEMLDAELTTTYGQGKVSRSDILDIDPGNGRATMVADLRVAEQFPANAFDCFILTQTLHLIDDMPAALRSAHRLLKPGGVLLVTMPCASMVAVEYGQAGDHWRVTEAGARALFEGVFEPSELQIQSHGNVLTTTAFLHGLACEDLDPGELAVDDPAYPLLVTIRARKSAPAVVSSGRASAAPLAAVLMYHRVADLSSDVHALAVSPGAFRSQIEYLRDAWQVMPLADLAAAVAAGEPPERAVALTFDDGYLDNLEIAAPMLEACGVPATFFVTSEPLQRAHLFWWDALERMLLAAEACPPRVEVRIGGRPRSFSTADHSSRRAAHDELYIVFKGSPPAVRDDLLQQLSRATGGSLQPDQHRPMEAAEVQWLRECSRITIGAHGVHHLSLPLLSLEECHREVFESRSALERLIGRDVTAFAYPFGDVSPDAVKVVMAAGFDHAVGCETRGLRAREHRLRLPRLATHEESGPALGARLERELRSGDRAST